MVTLQASVASSGTTGSSPMDTMSDESSQSSAPVNVCYYLFFWSLKMFSVQTFWSTQDQRPFRAKFFFGLGNFEKIKHFLNRQA